MGDFLMKCDELSARLGGPEAPLVYDLRRRPAFEADDWVLPTARWRDHRETAAWAEESPAGRDLVVYCVHGEQVSQSAAAALRARGLEARVLRGGIEGWRENGGLTLPKTGLPELGDGATGRWLTQLDPTIEQLAGLWFVRRFVDAGATFHFVAADQIEAAAKELDAIPLESFGLEALLRRFRIDDPVLTSVGHEVAQLRTLWRGLCAISAGDGEAADRGLTLCDGLYAALRSGAAESREGR